MKYREFLEKAGTTSTLMKISCDSMCERLDQIIDALGNMKLKVNESEYSYKTLDEEYLIRMKRTLLYLSNGENLVEVVEENED